MSFANLGRRVGNDAYKFAFRLYRPLYSTFKAYADHAERHILASHLSPGSVVVDAGANIGIYSQFLSKCVGSNGVVHSFEPAPDNFARLLAALSEFPNVRANQLAVGDRTGESLLYVSDHLNVDHRAYATKGESRRAVAIRTTTLDDYFRPGERVDLIKMDIQGYELHALRGAERVLAENPKIKLLFEIWPYGLRLAGTSGGDLTAFLRGKGFNLFSLQDKHAKPWTEPIGDPDNSTDYSNLFAQRRD